MDIAIMIEAQNGLTWSCWQNLAVAVEDLGFAGLYRSDHFTNAQPPDMESLELWVSLTWLASHTKHIEFGPLVSPLSVRNPVLTARMASAVDDLSGGRLTLGLGAGWQEREHEKFGFDLLELKPRFDRFEEGLEIITHLLRSKKPVTYEGNTTGCMKRPSCRLQSGSAGRVFWLAAMGEAHHVAGRKICR